MIEVRIVRLDAEGKVFCAGVDVADHAGDTIVVVCHGGVINLYLAIVVGLTGDDRTGFFYPNYTSIHRVAASSNGDRSVITINETSHLRNTGLPMGLFQKG